MVDLETLTAELAKPEYQNLRDRDAAIAMNAARATVPSPGTYVTEIGVLDILGPTDGETFLAALESAQENIPTLARAVRRLRGDTGIDVGNPTLQAQLTALATANVVTQAAAAALIARGSKQVPLFDVELGSDDVRNAREAMA